MDTFSLCRRGILLILLLMCVKLRGVKTQDSQVVHLNIKEELAVNTSIGNIATSLGFTWAAVRDREMTFQLLRDDDPAREWVSVDPASGEVVVIARLDRDVLCWGESGSCDRSIDTTRTDNTGAFQLVKVMVHIEDVNDNSPAFPARSHAVYISETAAANTWFALPSADDPDAGDFGIQRYELRGGRDTFSLEVSGGDVHLVLKKPVDRETQASYSLELFAFDGQDKSAAMTVDVSVLDANDNAPTFTRATYDVSVAENVAVGTVIVQIRARDPDSGSNGQITYEFSRKTATQFGGVFAIDGQSGEISVLSALDYGQHSSYDLGVVAKDQGPSSLQAYAQVRVSVRDLNDHAPSIRVSARGGAADAAPVEENAGAGAFVAHVSVTDPDGADNGKFRCQLDSPMFTLQQTYETEYKILTAAVFDRELRSSYSVNILCEDLGTPQQLSRKPLVVEVTDVNDNAPVFTRPSYQAAIEENSPPGLLLLTVNATDADSGNNANVTYSVQSSAVSVHPLTGALTTRTRLDHETAAEIRVVLVATDAGGLTATALLTLTVLDVNDCPPVFSQPQYTFSLRENLPGETEVGKVTANDADDAPHNRVLYLLRDAPPHFSVHSHTGVVTCLGSLDREAQAAYSFTVVGRDAGGLETSSQVSVLVSDENDHAPVVTATPRPLQVGAGAAAGDTVAYVTATDADTGRNAELRFSLLSAESPFSINSLTGAVVVSSSLEESVGTTFTLLIGVTDRGEPPLSTTGELALTVNASVGLAGGVAAGNGGRGTDTSLIIILLLTVTGVVSLALIVTIVVLIRRRRRFDDDQLTKAPGGGADAGAGDATVVGNFPVLSIEHAGQYGKVRQLQTTEARQNSANSTKCVTFPAAAGPGPRCEPPDYARSPRGEPPDYGLAASRHRLLYLGLPPGNQAMAAVPLSDQDSDRGSSDSGRGASEEETPDRGRRPPRSARAAARAAARKHAAAAKEGNSSRSSGNSQNGASCSNVGANGYSSKARADSSRELDSRRDNGSSRGAANSDNNNYCGSSRQMDSHSRSVDNLSRHTDSNRARTNQSRNTHSRQPDNPHNPSQPAFQRQNSTSRNIGAYRVHDCVDVSRDCPDAPPLPIRTVPHAAQLASGRLRPTSPPTQGDERSRPLEQRQRSGHSNPALSPRRATSSSTATNGESRTGASGHPQTLALPAPGCPPRARSPRGLGKSLPPRPPPPTPEGGAEGGSLFV